MSLWLGWSHEALAAAEPLQQEGISVEVIDPRLSSKTGRLVVADETGPTAGASAEISAFLTEDKDTFKQLKAPVRRLCALQVPTPYSPELENHVFPDRDKITAAVREILA